MEFEMRRVVGAAIRGLIWYFNQAESDAGLRSNYGGMIYRLAVGRNRTDSVPVEVTERVLETAARSRHIERALRAMDPDDQDIVWLAFGAPWPAELGDYGEIAALAPHTKAAQEAHRVALTTLPLLGWLARIARSHNDRIALQTIKQIHREAFALRRRAVAAYHDARRKVGHRG
jgi:hypothetical protein